MESRLFWKNMWHRRENMNSVIDLVETKVEEKDEIAIVGIIFKHGKDDFSFWQGFEFTEEENEQLNEIFDAHNSEGYSFRGTLRECFDDCLE